MRPVGSVFAILTALASCSTPSGGTIALLTEDPGIFTRAPVPTTIAVDSIDTTGAVTSLHQGPLSAGATIDLGDVAADAIATVRVTAKDDGGVTRVWGASLPVQLGALSAATLSLFVQRTGELATLPGSPSDARSAPRLAMAGGRYVLVAGGDDAATATSTQIYDLATWSSLASPPGLGRAPRSLAVASLRVLAIDDAGASWLDLTTATAADAGAPSGGTFAEVAGGDAVVAPDGTTYIVGATRATGPTPRVLRVSAAGDLAFATLATPRAGAAAGWVDGRGLVVAGGSVEGAGVEVLAAGASAATPLPFPADATAGAGLGRLDDTHALLVGGRDASGADAGLRTLDLACNVACAPGATKALPTTLNHVALFADPSGLLAVGDDAATGTTRAFVVDASVAREVALKTPRNHARALRIATGAIVLAGGAPSLESFAF